MLILALRGHSSHTVTENTGREVKLQLLTVVCVRRLMCVCARVCTYVCVCVMWNCRVSSRQCLAVKFPLPNVLCAQLCLDRCFLSRIFPIVCPPLIPAAGVRVLITVTVSGLSRQRV